MQNYKIFLNLQNILYNNFISYIKFLDYAISWKVYNLKFNGGWQLLYNLYIREENIMIMMYT